MERRVKYRVPPRTRPVEAEEATRHQLDHGSNENEEMILFMKSSARAGGCPRIWREEGKRLHW